MNWTLCQSLPIQCHLDYLLGDDAAGVGGAVAVVGSVVVVLVVVADVAR